MKILVGTVANADLIKQTILEIEDIQYQYEGKNGLNMVFSCNEPNDKVAVRRIKDALKALPELGGTFYNVTAYE